MTRASGCASDETQGVVDQGDEVAHSQKQTRQDALQDGAGVAATLPGMPLVYGGQEARLDKRIAFFEKDPVVWGPRPLEALYTELLQLKHAHPALANGAAGAPLEVIETGVPAVFAFRRAKGADQVTVVVNLSGEKLALKAHPQLGDLGLDAWGWRIKSS